MVPRSSTIQRYHSICNVFFFNISRRNETFTPTTISSIIFSQFTILQLKNSWAINSPPPQDLINSKRPPQMLLRAKFFEWESRPRIIIPWNSNETKHSQKQWLKKNQRKKKLQRGASNVTPSSRSQFKDRMNQTNSIWKRLKKDVAKPALSKT